jgi:hypothetical protein
MSPTLRPGSLAVGRNTTGDFAIRLYVSPDARVLNRWKILRVYQDVIQFACVENSITTFRFRYLSWQRVL